MKLVIERFADLDDTPTSFPGLGACDECVYWEYPKEFDEGVRDSSLKATWISGVLRDFGNCGLRARVNDDVVGFIQYAPPRYYGDRFSEYTSGPPSEDAVFISCLYIRDESRRGKGIATQLMQAAIGELRARGVPFVEALPRVSSAENPAGPVGFYLKQGFKVVQEEDDFPLVRLTL